MSVLTRATMRNIPEGGILNSHRRDNLKPYIELSSSEISKDGMLTDVLAREANMFSHHVLRLPSHNMTGLLSIISVTLNTMLLGNISTAKSFITMKNGVFKGCYAVWLL
jgi:hypothetical protein